jgi:hypothetical protein
MSGAAEVNVPASLEGKLPSAAAAAASASASAAAGMTESFE